MAILLDNDDHPSHDEGNVQAIATAEATGALVRVPLPEQPARAREVDSRSGSLVPVLARSRFAAVGWLLGALSIGCARHEAATVELVPVARRQAPPAIALRHARDAEAPHDESIVAFVGDAGLTVLQLALHETRRFGAGDVRKFSVSDSIVDVHFTDGGKTFVFEGAERGATTIVFERADGTTLALTVYVDTAPTPP